MDAEILRMRSQPQTLAWMNCPGECLELIDRLPGLVGIASRDGRFTFLNARVRLYLGDSDDRSDDVDMFSSSLHPADRQAFVSGWQAHRRQASTFRTALRVLRADGAYRWWQVELGPYETGSGIDDWLATFVDVDDQLGVEDALRKSECELRTLVDGIPGMLVATSPDGEVEYVNAPTLEAIGCPLETFKNGGWHDIIHPDDVEALGRKWMCAIASGEAMQAEYRQRLADGSYHWWSNRVQPLRDESGQILRWYGVITDVDDRRKAEDLLRLSEQSLRTLVDSIPGLLCVCGPSGDLEYVNEPMRALIGHPLEESKNFGWLDTIHKDDRAQLLIAWEAAVASGSVLDYEYRRLCPDSSYHWFQVRMQPQFAESGAILHWYALIIDVNDRRTAEEGLRTSERSLRQVIETLPALVWRASPDGLMDYSNHRFADSSGLPPELLLGTGWTCVIHPEDLDTTLADWATAIQLSSSLELKQRFRMEDGSFRWFRTIGEPMLDEEGAVRAWYGLHIDIDDREKLAEALRLTQAKLMRASAAAAISELAASIAHEVNQPLAAVVANAAACRRWLSAETPNFDRARSIINTIAENANQAGEIVARVRSLFRRSEPAKSEVQLGDLVGEVCRMMQAEFREAGITVSVANSTVPPVNADKVQIQQVVFNLLHNAADAIQASTSADRQIFVRLKAGKLDSVVVEIADTGDGIREPGLIFEPFVTTKTAGMGMGLAICRSVIEAHGGRLWLSGNRRVGATFSFEIPTDG